jgi:cytochrome c peroxidase
MLTHRLIAAQRLSTLSSSRLAVLSTRPLQSALKRTFSSEQKKQEAPKSQTPSNSGPGAGVFVALAVLTAGGFYAYTQSLPTSPPDYQQVYNDIAALLDKNSDYDDGSFGPVLVRLAWHAAGTYDKSTKTGGSNGATMRFSPESAHGANAGLSVARDLLDSIKSKYPGLSYADLWSLAGVVAIQEMVCSKR